MTKQKIFSAKFILAIMITAASGLPSSQIASTDTKIDTLDKGGFSIVIPATKTSVKNPNPDEPKDIDFTSLFALRGWMTKVKFTFHNKIPKDNPPITVSKPLMEDDNPEKKSFPCLPEIKGINFHSNHLDFLPYKKALIVLQKNSSSSLVGFAFEGQIQCNAIMDKSIFSDVSGPYRDFKLIKRTRKERSDQFDENRLFLALNYPQSYQIQILNLELKFGGSYQGKIYQIEESVRKLGIGKESRYRFSRIGYEKDKVVLVALELQGIDGKNNGILFAQIDYENSGFRAVYTEESQIPRFDYHLKGFKMTYNENYIVLISIFSNTDKIGFTSIKCDGDSLELMGETEYLDLALPEGEEQFISKPETLFELEDEIVNNRIRLYFATHLNQSYVVEYFIPTSEGLKQHLFSMNDPKIHKFYNLPGTTPLGIDFLENSEFFQIYSEVKDSAGTKTETVSLVYSFNHILGFPTGIIRAPRLQSPFKTQPNLAKFFRKYYGSSSKKSILVIKPPPKDQQDKIQTTVYNLRNDVTLHVYNYTYLNLTHDTFKITTFNEAESKIFTLRQFLKLSGSDNGDDDHKYLIPFLVFLGLFVTIFLCIGCCHLFVFKNGGKRKRRRRRRRKTVKKQEPERDPSVVYMEDVIGSVVSIGGKKDEKLINEGEGK